MRSAEESKSEKVADPSGKDKAKITPDRDLIYCPISLEIMQHPILASDGRHYELKELHRQLLEFNNMRSSLDRSEITTVTYDVSLKSTLDKNFIDFKDRYEPYEYKPLLDEIHAILPRTWRDHERQQRLLEESREHHQLLRDVHAALLINTENDKFHSRLAFGIQFLILGSCFCIAFHRDDRTEQLLILALTAAIANLAHCVIRTRTNNTYGLFGRRVENNGRPESEELRANPVHVASGW